MEDTKSEGKTRKGWRRTTIGNEKMSQETRQEVSDRKKQKVQM